MILGPRGGEIVSRGPAEFEEFRGHFDADGVAAAILAACITVAITKITGEWLC